MRRRENQQFPLSSQGFVPSWDRTQVQSQTWIADALVQGARRSSPSGFAYAQGIYQSATQWDPSQNGDSDDYGSNNDLQLDAFDLELLAQSDRQSRCFSSSSQKEGFSSYQLHQPGFPKQVSRFFEDSQATPRQSFASSSSDADIRDASSPLARLQREKSTLPRDWGKEAQRTNKGSSSYSTDLSDSYTQPNISASKPFQQMPAACHGIVLVSAQELPGKYRSLFQFPCFNAVQSKCFPAIYKSDDNLVLAAPTGSGKTVIMELAICRLLNTLKDEQFKVVYQAPTKSLCSERFQDWSRKFSCLGLQCAELTGDTEYIHLRSVRNSQIIITTPEKWDSMTRKWKDHARLMQLVKLFLIDEVHTLKETRGATLEAVVSRMKTFGSNVRFIALSATIPNSEDIATWLGRNSTNQHIPAHRQHFGEEFRPVKLQKFIYGYQASGNDFAFDKFCNSKLPGIISAHAAGKPIIIFCCTRNSAMNTAKELARLWSASNAPARLWTGPNRPLGVSHADLKITTRAGVAFHHAGLEPGDRHQVESGFLDRKISIICCTSTLAVGVNLPCHLVIIKGTVGWQDGHCQEYSDLEVIQMLGRAGRPQFDDSATAVILTRKERVKHYEKLVSGSESLESCLHLNLIDHLNAEIGLGNVTSIQTAINWLASTFLFVRLRRNPMHYTLKEGANQDDENEILRQICEKDIKLLQESGLVTSESLKTTPFGDAMARYYVRFETMRIFLSLKPRSDIGQILSVISQAEEFREIRIKSGEKSIYKEINRSSDIKFPINVDIALPAHKTSLLIQAELGGLNFPVNEQFQKHRFPFQQDKSLIFTHVNRLIRCIIDCKVHVQDSVTICNALELARSLAAKSWDNSPLQMKQIEQIGTVAVRKLVAAGIESIADLEVAEPHQIEMALSRNPPFGVKLRDRLVDFPKLRVMLKMIGKDIKPSHEVRIRFKAEVAFMNEKCPTVFQARPVYVCFVAETSDGRLLDFRRISANKLHQGLEIFLSAELISQDQYISCHVMCDEIAGTAQSAVLKIYLPSSYFRQRSACEYTVEKFRNDSHIMADGGNSQANKPRKTRIHRLNSDELLFGELLALGVFDDWNEVAPCANPESKRTMPRANLSKNERENPSSTVKSDLDDWSETGPSANPSDPKRIAVRTSSSGNEHAKPSVMTKSNPVTNYEPSKLENGRWACNHKCKDKSACKHFCCREGLDRLPKAGRKKSDGSAPEPVGLNQLTLSSKIVKRAHQSSSVSDTTKQGKKDKKNNKPGAGVGNIPELLTLREGDVPLSSSMDPSDYGDENFDDLPSPEELLFGKAHGLKIDSTKGTGAAEAVGSALELGDDWFDPGDVLLPVQSPLIQALEKNSEIVDLITPEPQEMSLIVRASYPCGGSKRKNSEVEIYGLCSEENKRTKTSEMPEPLLNKDIETKPRPALDTPRIPLDWDDIDHDIMEEFKDYVVFI
ncbi:Sec63 Brl domain-containing protein [Aspergillus granulosus]|uniref:DNA 3'-5' helicase n=1 Tax=Aspergillus granulosus TaxID=176169 RepID=A0ABR4H3J1_9EURO